MREDLEMVEKPSSEMVAQPPGPVLEKFSFRRQEMKIQMELMNRIVKIVSNT